MKKYIEIILFVAVGVAVYFLVIKKLFSRAAQSREFLHTLGFGVADMMTDSEAITAATYIRDYTQKGRRLVAGSAFANAVNAVSNKYGIF